MIYTLTMNAAIDLNLSCAEVESEKVNRVSESDYSPNGKAINVSIVLDHFGVDSVAMGVFGGFTGKHIVECLKEKGINVHPFYIDGRTRINVFVSDGDKEYKFVSKGGFVSQDVKNDILASIRGASDMEYLIISGSLPPGVEAEYLDQIMAACKENHVEVILDISDRHLTHLLTNKPLLIKPNDDELLSVFGLHAATHEQALDSLETLHSLGAQNVLLTLGRHGMYFSNGESVHFCNAPEIKLHSSACAGDAALAAFLSLWLKDRSKIQEAIQVASAVGADVAASAGVGELALYPQLVTMASARRVA